MVGLRMWMIYIYLYLRHKYLYLYLRYIPVLEAHIPIPEVLELHVPVEVEEDEAAPGGYLDGLGWDTGLGYWR